MKKPPASKIEKLLDRAARQMEKLLEVERVDALTITREQDNDSPNLLTFTYRVRVRMEPQKPIDQLTLALKTE